MEYDETAGAGGQLNYTAEELQRLYPNSFPPTQPNAYYQAGYAPAEEAYQGVQGAWPDDQFQARRSHVEDRRNSHQLGFASELLSGFSFAALDGQPAPSLQVDQYGNNQSFASMGSTGHYLPPAFPAQTPHSQHNAYSSNHPPYRQPPPLELPSSFAANGLPPHQYIQELSSLNYFPAPSILPPTSYHPPQQLDNETPYSLPPLKPPFVGVDSGYGSYFHDSTNRVQGREVFGDEFDRNRLHQAASHEVDSLAKWIEMGAGGNSWVVPSEDTRAHYPQHLPQPDSFALQLQAAFLPSHLDNSSSSRAPYSTFTPVPTKSIPIDSQPPFPPPQVHPYLASQANFDYHASIVAPPPAYEHLFPFDESLITPPRERSLSSESNFFNPSTLFPPVSSGYPSTPSSPIITGAKRGKTATNVPRQTTQFNAEGVRLDLLESIPGRKGQKKITKETEFSCTQCGILIGKLILRGRDQDFATPHSAAFTCANCMEGTETTNNYRTSISSGNASSQSPESDTAKGKGKADSFAAPNFRKKSKRPTEALTACDVCVRDIASGQLLANDSQSVVTVAMEVVCKSCSEKYMRCSDCGGGGGVRLGVGKWRSKEMFNANRKTCTLSHLRLGPFSSMNYDIWAIRDIPTEEIEDVIERCRVIFVNTLLSSMATPEVLERGSVQVAGPPLSSHAGVVAFAEGGFSKFAKMMRTDVESETNIRRYLALRFCTPNPRKGNRKAADNELETLPGGLVLRPKKELVGFVLSEYDITFGSLFTVCAVPWATGEVLDGQSHLMETQYKRVESDREELNLVKARLGLPEAPFIMHIWTMMFFKKESRMRVHLEKKRGFLTLEEYLAKYPDTNLATFPPYRKTYVDPHNLHYWELLIKRAGPGANVFFAARTKPKTADEIKGKKKEKRAEELRLEAEREEG